MNTNDLVQFNWKTSDSPEEPILLTIDSDSSKISDAVDGRTGTFDSCEHKCRKMKPVVRDYFHACQVFLLNIPRHGLYNFAYSNNPENVLISLIVENGINTHHVIYDKNKFEKRTITINRLDQVEFAPSAITRARIIYRTDQYSNRLEFEKTLFQPQENSINYFVKQFSQLGIYYFSTDTVEYPLAIIVLPEIRFHFKSISKGNFDSKPIITTNANDFVIWKFEKTIHYDVIMLNSNETLENVMSCQDEANYGKSRRCLALNCKSLSLGASYFANPDFERITGEYEDLLISTIIIDRPFIRNSFSVCNNQFVPKILYIAENDTVAWISIYEGENHRVCIQSNRNDNENDKFYINRNIDEFVHGVYHLHTFTQPGKYFIKCRRFQNAATVIVYSNIAIQSQKRQVQQPRIKEKINGVSKLNTRIHLVCPNHRNAAIYYTLDGSLPTHNNNNLYNPDQGIRFRKPGFHLLRAYATEDQQLSSSVQMSCPKFVTEEEDLESLWDSCQITLSALLEHPNKIYGKIEIEPTHSLDLIDHFELYINGIVQKLVRSSKDVHFPTHGFAADEQYQIHVVAHPKDHIIDAEPIPSNRRAFNVKRRIQGGAPSVYLALSNGRSTIFLTGEQSSGDATRSTDEGESDDGNIQKPQEKIAKQQTNDFKDRAKILLKKLRQAIENRSKEINSTDMHPHISYPGTHHYTGNQFLSQTSSHDSYIDRRQSKSEQRSSRSNANLSQNYSTSADDT